MSIIFKLIALVNVAFVLTSESYILTIPHVPSRYTSFVICAILALAFAKDLYDYYDFSKERWSLYSTLNTVSLVCTGICASLALLIPRILYLENQHLDSVTAKFGIKITRIWSHDELFEYALEFVKVYKVDATISPVKLRFLADHSDSVASLKSGIIDLCREHVVVTKSLWSNACNYLYQYPVQGSVMVLTSVILALGSYLLFRDILDGSATSGFSQATRAQHGVNDSLFKSIEALAKDNDEVRLALARWSARTLPFSPDEMGLLKAFVQQIAQGEIDVRVGRLLSKAAPSSFKIFPGDGHRLGGTTIKSPWDDALD